MPRSLAFGPASVIYALSSTTDEVQRLSYQGPPFGVLALQGSALGTGSTPTAIAVNFWRDFAYVVNSGSNDISAYRIDATTGALSSAGARVPAGTQPEAIAIDE